MRMFAGRIWRDHGLDPALSEFIAQAFGVVGPVSQQAPWTSNHADQNAGTDEIVGIARRNQEGKRTANIVGQRVDFGGLTAAGAADRVIEGPPFAPAAER